MTFVTEFDNLDAVRKYFCSSCQQPHPYHKWITWAKIVGEMKWESHCSPYAYPRFRIRVSVDGGARIDNCGFRYIWGSSGAIGSIHGGFLLFCRICQRGGAVRKYFCNSCQQRHPHHKWIIWAKIVGAMKWKSHCSPYAYPRFRIRVSVGGGARIGNCGRICQRGGSVWK